jgi:WhiB family redox-sensing transcriptional regulator
VSTMTRTAWGMDSGGGGDWRDRAACRDEDPELFFPAAGAGSTLGRIQVAAAVRVCEHCPVRTSCADEVQRTRGTGIWAGQHYEAGRVSGG